ncbi:hypothetical protein H2199_000067 [Coniosporium tulheliwenetii]|uniref:Uncharacterized protein n=1 Tax=Coniosporium tulheliwenetii TaxID=3383036 RepID=A0ACC2ZNV4_9PEZI|nr:hypothetical protein H2199_000067 [Cladosporium sp. JES 115]
MTTIVETLPSGETIYRCPDKSDLCSAKENTVIHASAANPSHCYTKAQARTLTQRTAHVLRNRYGIGADGPGKDVVSCINTGTHLVPLLFYAVVAAGGAFSAASSASTPVELARTLKMGESKLLVCTEDLRDVALKAAKEAGLREDKVLVMGGSEEGQWGLRGAGDLKDVPISEEKLDWPRITDQKELEDSLIVLIYSSGTTGLPKGVRLSHTNLVAETIITLEPLKAYMRAHNPSFEYRTLAHLPTAHIAGIQGYLINPFYMGGPAYWMPRFDFVQFLEYNKKYRVTFFFTVPPIYLLIAKSPLVTDQFDTCEFAVSGAAPLGKELQHAASAKLGKGKIMISQTWGLSETTGSITLLPHGRQDDTGSVSCLVPNAIARIVDDEGKDVPVGQPGEVIVKAPIVTKGYHKNPEANKEAFIDGWFRTGDIALFKDGMFYIVDRKKELIKYKGLQVAPAELEALLLSHPLILDAAVIGVEAEGTEVPRAYVVADRQKMPPEKIEAFVADNVADYKRLRGGVVYLDAIPKSPSGKILRKDLREMARREGRARL